MESINIVGMGKGKFLAPAKNCWGVNSLIFERDVDLHFDMHHPDKLEPHQAERRKKIIEVANKKRIPVLSCEHIPDTTYVRYPIGYIMRMFPRAYFSNAVSYMIALALAFGYEQINLYGVNHAKIGVETTSYAFKDIVSSYDLDVMDKSTRQYVESMWDVPQSQQGTTIDQYLKQKPAVDYWIGVADGMGVELNICNEESELCKTYDGNAYGYKISQEEMVKQHGPDSGSGNR
jgi:hypothetical protein